MRILEITVLRLWKEFPAMNDKDVEFVYSALKDYFRKKAQDKTPEEPLHGSERRQALIDELLNAIEEREEMEADIGYINRHEYAPAGKPIPSLPAFYVMCLNRLVKSVQFWRKEIGKRGYLTFIRNHVM